MAAKLSRLWKYRFLYLLGLPGMAILFLFHYLPMGSLLMAFEDYDPWVGLIHSPFVGLKHFAKLFNDSKFYLMLWNTLKISMLSLITFPAPIILALLLNEVRSSAYKKTIQTAVYLPHFLSWTIVVSLTFFLLSSEQGLINKIIVSTGGQAHAFLFDKSIIYYIIVIQSVWKGVGWGSIVYLAATEGEGQKIYALDFYGDLINNARTTAFAVAFTGQMDWGFDEEGNFQYICFNPNYINFLDWMKDLYDAGVLDPEFALGNSDTSKWKGGRSVAFLTAWYNWNQSADRVTNRIFDSVCPDTYECWCLMPVEGDNGIVISANSSDIDSCIAISSSVDEAKLEKILQVFCATEEEYPGYNNVMSYGVEGLHFYFDENGTRQKTDEQRAANTAGYVGAWNQIFLKVDADQITSKFMRSGASRASDENIQRARDIRAVLANYLDETGLGFANQNLFSETYNTSWANIVSDTNANITKYIMGEISADEWNAFVDSVVNGAEYQAIIAEYAASAK